MEGEGGEPVASRRSSRERKKVERYDPDKTVEPLFCLCRGIFKRGQFMLQCDACKEWYHGSCVGVEPQVRGLYPPAHSLLPPAPAKTPALKP